ncbi:DegT/DnrJ/EryC1/StrS family aminotransferase [Crocosphaera chwakensis]|uniref:DegT/DnrJ/EryC1/StrS family protein n=1 Tax=Crocosphaera chwakensis CCY0110 TaxID=391612 RepID=A3IPF4_9CHRO|nr:DegT/DnrJ/EryC1/StrS family aminotransferase [Crocosphaera chwakensis]EAZ91719.1 DegT/DnrJ/EryC1/StrS family protein [Crocosphaera chwakensis CCY0110]
MIVSSKTIPFVDLTLQHQPIQADIEQAISTVVQRGDFILGKTLKEFEAEFAQASGVKYGVGVASGTDAIALGLQACGITQGDDVLVPANTFIATVMGVIQAGATPILVDCDPHTALIDLNLAAKAITPKTKAILPVHLYGQMVSPRALLDFAQVHDLIIFEDAAQAHLAQREGYKAGSVGMAAAFSFYPSKNLGAFGNGGMLITSDEDVAQRVRTLRNYGAPKKYYHTEVGKNSRLDTLQAAILQVKLPYLPQWNQLRNQAGQIYDQGLKSGEDKGIITIKNLSQEGHVYHLYVIRINKDCSMSRDQVQQFLAERGIQTGIHYPIPCHLQPAYKSLGYQLGDFPQAEMLCEQILSLPMYPGITSDQIAWVIEQLSLI